MKTAKSFNAELKSTFTLAREDANTMLTNPLRIMNLLNSSAWKKEEGVRAALKFVKAHTNQSKWHMDLLARDVEGRVCRVGKRIKEEEVDYTLASGKNVCRIGGDVFACTLVTSFSVNSVLSLIENNLKAVHGVEGRIEKAFKAEERAAKKAEREAAKAAKAAAKEDAVLNGLTREQLLARLAALDSDAAAAFAC